MAITIVATAGSASANSFCTEAAFIAYAATLSAGALPSGTTVSGSTCTEAEKAAMVEATRELSLLEYDGTRVDATQVLSWPRAWAVNPDSPSLEYLGNVELLYFATTAIPTRVVNATIEYALAIIAGGTSDILATDTTQGVIRKVVGPLETEWASPAARAQGLNRWPRVARFLDGLLCRNSGGLTLMRV